MERGRLKNVEGTVISDKQDKTIVVRAERKVKHPRYGKFVRQETIYHAHDEEETAKSGDIVELAATRPLSKSKRWRLLRVIRAVGGVETLPRDVEGGEE